MDRIDHIHHAIIDTVRGSKPDETEKESADDDNMKCDRLLAYLETRISFRLLQVHQ